MDGGKKTIEIFIIIIIIIVFIVFAVSKSYINGTFSYSGNVSRCEPTGSGPGFGLEKVSGKRNRKMVIAIINTRQ